MKVRRIVFLNLNRCHVWFARRAQCSSPAVGQVNSESICFFSFASMQDLFRTLRWNDKFILRPLVSETDSAVSVRQLSRLASDRNPKGRHLYVPSNIEPRVVGRTGRTINGYYKFVRVCE